MKALITLFIAVLILSFSVYALTGSIGNARMVLKAEVGDTIQKYILVKNVNDEAVNITLSASGNLTKDTKIIDNSFILQPGDEKKAYFTIKARQPGSYETRISVQFLPLDKGNGVGLNSVVLLNVYGQGELLKDNETDIEENVNDEETDEEGITGAVIGENLNVNLVLLIFMSLLTLILIILLIFIIARKKKVNKKRSDRSS